MSTVDCIYLQKLNTTNITNTKKLSNEIRQGREEEKREPIKKKVIQKALPPFNSSYSVPFILGRLFLRYQSIAGSPDNSCIFLDCKKAIKQQKQLGLLCLQLCRSKARE